MRNKEQQPSRVQKFLDQFAQAFPKPYVEYEMPSEFEEIIAPYRESSLEELRADQPQQK